MKYEGVLTHDCLADVRRAFDNKIIIEENVCFYREVPENIYKIDLALGAMNDDEINKLIKYIMRITNNRLSIIFEE